MGHRVVIVGAGALGSHLLMLTRNLDADFTIIDFDRVEQKNTLSQFHTKMGLNKNKAQAIVQSMKGLWGVKVDCKPHRLTELNVSQMLDGATVVVDAVDNIEARNIISLHCKENGIPCLHGGLAPNGEFGVSMWNEKFKPDAEPEEGAATCEDGEHLLFIALVASVMGSSLKSFIESPKNDRFDSFMVSPANIIKV